jgi:hypothetical protein
VRSLSESLALVAVALALLAMLLALVGIPFREIVHDVLEFVKASLGR